VLPGGSTAAADVAGHLGSPEALEAALLDPGNGTADGPLPGINCGALFGLLEWSSALIQRMGAPAREAKAAAAQAGVRRDLLAATAPADAAAVVARALRLLSVLLSLLRLDVANAHLAALVARLGAEGSGAPGVAYARLKLAHEGHLGPVDCETSAGELAERLPHTRAWLALASGRLPQLESLFTAGTAQPKRTPTSSSGVAVQSSKSSAGGVPGSLRTGKASLTAAGPSGSSASALAALSAPKLELPVAVRSWRALVRCGLVQLVVGDGAVTSLALPETLKADAGRLFAAQNEFQRALVLAACLATAQQLPGSELSSHHGPASHERAERAKRRLKAVLAAQDVVLADIVAEVAALVCPIEPPSAQLEQSTQSMLRDMLSKNSPGMRALTAGLRDALVAHMLQGPEEGARHVADAALAAVGAGALRAEVEALAASLGRIAAVSEAVCEPWYCLLSSDLFT